MAYGIGKSTLLEIGKKFKRQATHSLCYPLIGQGTVIYNIERHTPFQILIRNSKVPDQFVELHVGQDGAPFNINNGNEHMKLRSHVSGKKIGFEPNNKIGYWFSFNRDRLVLKYGKGYIMEETTHLTYDFLEGVADPMRAEKIRKKYSFIFAPHIEKHVELYDFVDPALLVRFYAANMLALVNLAGYDYNVSLFNEEDKYIKQIRNTIYQHSLDPKTIQRGKSMVDIEKKVDFYPYPLIVNWPHVVLNSSEISLFELDCNRYTFSASLPQACRELFDNVAQKNVELDWPPGAKIKLSDAIRYSIITEGKLLNKKLKEKEGEFGIDDKETYLRVTLGQSHGNSPGIPYVLEIWPAGHGSPIHNHGNAYAVIKCLHGSINVKLYNKLVKKGDEPLNIFDVKQGDVTWISPNWYQTHKLWNTTDDFCATIQCYQFGKEDFLKWPMFEYMDDNYHLQEFLPNSDFKFTDFSKLLMDEYAKATENKIV